MRRPSANRLSREAEDDARSRELERFLDPDTDLSDTRVVENVLATLTNALVDSSSRVRHSALETMGQLWLERGFAASELFRAHAEDLAEDPDGRVRAELARLLALLPDNGMAAETLVASGGLKDRLSLVHALLEDGAPAVRREAAAAAGDLRDETAIPWLLDLLTDEESSVRFEAAFALATLRNEGAAPLLERALEDKRQRLDACEGLRRLGANGSIHALSRLARKFWLAWPDRLTALATMHALGDETAGVAILARARSRSREERAYALSLIASHGIEAGIPVLESVARDERDVLRDVAVRSLAELRDERMAPLFRDIAGNPRSPEDLRLDAVEALEKIPTHLAKQFVEAVLAHDSSLRQALEHRSSRDRVSHA